MRNTGGGQRKTGRPGGPSGWEAEIYAEDKGGAVVYSDGSLLEGGNVGGGAYVVEENGERALLEQAMEGGS